MPEQAPYVTTPSIRHVAAASLRTVRLRRSALLLLACLPLFIRACHGDDRVLYLNCGFAILLSAAALWQVSRVVRSEQARWRMVAGAQLLHSLSYFAPAMLGYSLLSYRTAAWISNFGAAICWTMFVPALLAMRTERTLLVRMLDLLLVVASGVLLTCALGSGKLTGDGMTLVWTDAAVITLLSLLALFTRFVKAGGGLRHFTRVILYFLLSTLAVVMLVDVVLPLGTTFLDVLVNTLAPLPALLLCDLAWQRSAPLTWPELRLDHALIDSMQPSLLTLASVAFAMFAFRQQHLLAAACVMAIVLCYTLRTHAFYSRLFHERTRLKSEATHLHRLATHDALTGVGNRRWFEANIHRWLADANAYPCTLLLADIDYFKQINDVHGHHVGDQILCMVADVLQHGTESLQQACIARLGGDEFALLLPGQTSHEAATTAENLRSAVESLGKARDLHVTISIGAATATLAATRADILQAADEALYRVKANNRNGVANVNLTPQAPEPSYHFLHDPEPELSVSEPLA